MKTMREPKNLLYILLKWMKENKNKTWCTLRYLIEHQREANTALESDPDFIKDLDDLDKEFKVDRHLDIPLYQQWEKIEGHNWELSHGWYVKQTRIFKKHGVPERLAGDVPYLAQYSQYLKFRKTTTIIRRLNTNGIYEYKIIKPIPNPNYQYHKDIADFHRGYWNAFYDDQKQKDGFFEFDAARRQAKTKYEDICLPDFIKKMDLKYIEI